MICLKLYGLILNYIVSSYYFYFILNIVFSVTYCPLTDRLVRNLKTGYTESAEMN